MTTPSLHVQIRVQYKLKNSCHLEVKESIAVSIDPKHVTALDDKGLALDHLGNRTGAIEYFDKALAIDPKFEDALYDKGLVLDKLGLH